MSAFEAKLRFLKAIVGSVAEMLLPRLSIRR
jgi:hypothetical protein